MPKGKELGQEPKVTFQIKGGALIHTKLCSLPISTDGKHRAKAWKRNLFSSCTLSWIVDSIGVPNEHIEAGGRSAGSSSAPFNELTELPKLANEARSGEYLATVDLPLASGDAAGEE